MKYITVLCLTLLLLSCNLSNNKSPIVQNEFRYEIQIDSLAETFLTDSLMNSISIGIYNKGNEFTKHYGELDPRKNNKPNDQTIYDIASVSKTFVGTLIAQAELDGKLSLEDDIRNYLNGDFPNLQYENEPIRIKHLVTHSSGLPTFCPIKIGDEFSKANTVLDLSTRVSNIEKNYTRFEFFQDLKKIKIDTIPGYKYNYSNIGAELASHILEQVYEKPFETLLEEKICQVANMTSTIINIKESHKQNYANGYGKYLKQKPHMKTKLWGGSGFAKSTTKDLLNYIKYHLDKDNLIVQKSHEILFDKDIIDGNPKVKMGYMWQVGVDRDFGQVLQHHGGGHGMQNWIFIFPHEEFGISVVTNQSGRNTAGQLLNVAYGILDAMAKDRK